MDKKWKLRVGNVIKWVLVNPFIVVVMIFCFVIDGFRSKDY